MKGAVAVAASVNNQEERLPLARILRDSTLELLLTFLMLFCVIRIVRWVTALADFPDDTGDSCGAVDCGWAWRS